MNEQASIFFNISSSIGGVRAGKGELSLPHSYLQRSIYTALIRSLYKREGVESLGRQLAAIARHAYFARQMETVEQASQLMLALPLSKELKSIAQYYQALCFKRKGDLKNAYELLQGVVDEAPTHFRARGLLSIGATHFDSGEIESAAPFFLKAARIAGDQDIQTFVTAQRMIAVIRSVYEDHQRALNDLEQLFPAVRAIARYYPSCYYEFLNSYAVELGEAGRIAEAENVCAITLASPFAAAYPEIAQTRDELAAKRTAATPSVIAVPATAPEIIPSPQAQVEPEQEPARARSTISLKLRRHTASSRVLPAAQHSVTARLVSTRIILDRLVEPALPRSPPALS
jgi:tetratricopeptide (TPR) repeat protein